MSLNSEPPKRRISSHRAKTGPKLNTPTIDIARRTSLDERKIDFGKNKQGYNLFEEAARDRSCTGSYHCRTPLVHWNTGLWNTARRPANPDSLGIFGRDWSHSSKQSARALAQNRHLLGNNSHRSLGSIRSRQRPKHQHSPSLR